MKTNLISSRFLYEAMNQRLSRFLREATGGSFISLVICRFTFFRFHLFSEGITQMSDELLVCHSTTGC